MKKVLYVLLTLVVIVGLFLGTLTLLDYRPEAVEVLNLTDVDNPQDLKEGLNIITWNIGYAGLGAGEDFFMDGGQNARAMDQETVEAYLSQITTALDQMAGDVVFLQEVDIDSKRSYYVNQLNTLVENFTDYDYSFAKNYDVKFVPVPWPPMGKVKSGILTFSKIDLMNATRYQFTGNYDWPMSTVMLDRCFMVNDVRVGEKNVRLINVHLSAYDDGTLKDRQMKELKDYLVESYEAGYHIIVGGDWNQTFESLDNKRFITYASAWQPGVVMEAWLNEGWQFGVNDNAPTYRLLDKPYDGTNANGVIDGFLVSPNVMIEAVEVVDLDFQASDHNPVMMRIRLK